MAYELYHYDPSSGAAVAFAAVFGLTTVVHFFQLVRARGWYMLSFAIGGVFEALGYLCRYINSTQTPNWTTPPYIGQSLLILLAPSLMAASVYMVLGRIIRLLNAGSISPIRPNWLTKIFVTGDVLSFFMQSGGGGILAQAKTKDKLDLGQRLILIGLFVQIVFFGFFIVVSIIFHRRMLSTPMHYMMGQELPWSRYMKVLYVVSVLIMVRSVYRVIEYAQGTDGALMSTEAYVYVFDATLMLLCCGVLNVFHPSKLLSRQGYKRTEDHEMLNNNM